MKRFHAIKYLIVALFLTMSFFTNAQPNDENKGFFPFLAGENLNGKAFHLPQDLPAEKTLVLIAFEREQQVVLDSWSHGLDLLNGQIAWIEIPVISTPYVLGSFIINSGMRRGIPNPKIRERVITIYTDREAFAKSMGIEYNKNEAYVAVVDRSGKNLGFVKGLYDENKAREILSLLGIK